MLVLSKKVKLSTTKDLFPADFGYKKYTLTPIIFFYLFFLNYNNFRNIRILKSELTAL